MPLTGIGGKAAVSRGTTAPGPIDISSTSVSNSGGTGIITGLNFVTLPNAYARINGTDIALTVSFIGSSKLTYTLAAGSYTAGVWPLTITNPDGQLDTENIFEITTIVNPQTTLGANLYAWYISTLGITTSSGLVTQWNDQSGNGLHLTAAGSARPTYNATTTHFSGAYPSVTFDGVANQLVNTGASVNLGSNDLFVYCVYRFVVAGASKYVFGASQVAQVFAVGSGASTNIVAFDSLIQLASGVNTTTSDVGVYGYSHGTASSAETIGVNVANASEQTTTNSITQFQSAAGVSIALGAKPSASSNFANIEVVECLIANVKPSSAQLNALYAYFNNRYALDTTLSYTGATDVLTTTGDFARIAGTGFNATTTVSITVGAVKTLLTTGYSHSGSIYVTGLGALNSGAGLSAGQYDLQIDNPNSGLSLNVSKGLTATATKKPDTILQRKLTGWARADRVTLNSTTVSACDDLARLGNQLQQTTAANQPPYNSANTSFSSQPTMGFTGSPVRMVTAQNEILDSGNGKTYWACCAFKQTSTTGTQTLHGYGTTQIGRDVSGVPSTVYGGANIATWGSNIGTALQKTYHGGIYDGTTNTKVIVNVNFGTEVTTTFAGSQTQGNNPWQLGSNSTPGNYLLADVAEVIMCDVEPSAGEKADLATYFGRY